MEGTLAIFNKNPTSKSALAGMLSAVKGHTMLSMLHSSENVSKDTRTLSLYIYVYIHSTQKGTDISTVQYHICEV